MGFILFVEIKLCEVVEIDCLLSILLVVLDTENKKDDNMKKCN